MNYHCAKFYTNISKNVDATIFSYFSQFFSQNFDYFTPKIAILEPIQLDIIANIVS